MKKKNNFIALNLIALFAVLGIFGFSVFFATGCAKINSQNVFRYDPEQSSYVWDYYNYSDTLPTVSAIEVNPGLYRVVEVSREQGIQPKKIEVYEIAQTRFVDLQGFSTACLAYKIKPASPWVVVPWNDKDKFIVSEQDSLFFVPQTIIQNGTRLEFVKSTSEK